MQSVIACLQMIPRVEDAWMIDCPATGRDGIHGSSEVCGDGMRRKKPQVCVIGLVVLILKTWMMMLLIDAGPLELDLCLSLLESYSTLLVLAYSTRER